MKRKRISYKSWGEREAERESKTSVKKLLAEWDKHIDDIMAWSNIHQFAYFSTDCTNAKSIWLARYKQHRDRIAMRIGKNVHTKLKR